MHRAEVLPLGDWRIDELAQRAEIAVDTIRYYQREGLLPSGERNGRTRRFGPEHLERLERIRALQSRRFSLAAIRALLDRDDPAVLADLLIGSEEATYDHDELVKSADVDPELVAALTDAGFLKDPAEHGRAAYDGYDVNVLHAVADLAKLDVPTPLLVAVARVYAEGLERIHGELVELFAVDDHADATHFRALAAGSLERITRDMRVIADYAQQRAMQRALLTRLQTAQGQDAPGTPDTPDDD